MKTIVCLALLLIGLNAFAQTDVPALYSPTALSYTNGWADNSTNSTPSTVLAAKRSDLIGWQLSYNLAGVGTGTNYFDFQKSLDNTNWPAAYFYTVALVANGTNTVVTNGLMNLEGMGYYRLARSRFASNGASSYPTNLLYLETPKPNLR